MNIDDKIIKKLYNKIKDKEFKSVKGIEQVCSVLDIDEYSFENSRNNIQSPVKGYYFVDVNSNSDPYETFRLYIHPIWLRDNFLDNYEYEILSIEGGYQIIQPVDIGKNSLGDI